MLSVVKTPNPTVSRYFVKMQQQVLVCIPVYNAFSEALVCLESVVRHSSDKIEILVIDDASPEGEFSKLIQTNLKIKERVKVIRNASNLGFVKTCNRALLEFAAERDVILLNSDTEVTQRWIEKLQQAAYSKPKVATVTPLTNNGTICSAPKFGVDNQLPANYSLEQFAALVERVSIREYPELPTCVGFCVYIRYAAIKTIGGFDAEAFGKGYGEENDFSCRARKAGFIDILDDSTFIWHKGNMSFKSTRNDLSASATAIIKKRHPSYFGAVGRFCRSFPLYNVHRRIQLAMLKDWSKRSKGSILHILHNGPKEPRHHSLGGTELHVKDLIEGNKDRAQWSLVRDGIVFVLTAHHPDFDCEFLFDVRTTTLKDLLQPEYFNLIHLHHSRWMNYAELVDALKAHGNYILSSHDFFTICPRINLLTPTRTHCSGHECVSACGLGTEFISNYRRLARELLLSARQRVVFSRSTADYYDRILKEQFEWRLLPHGISADIHAPKNNSCSLKPDETLRIAFLGSISQHKGQSIIERLVENTVLKNGRKIEWSVIGKFFGELPTHVQQLGAYNRETLAQHFDKVRPHIVAILSICPETYSLTLDESWRMGVPALVTPLGAPAERVKSRGAGWILETLTVESVLMTLESISKDTQQYTLVAKQAAQMKLLSFKEELQEYETLYDRLICKSSSDCALLIEELSAHTLRHVPELSFLKRALRPLINQGIIALEKLKLRPVVEKMAYNLIPRKVLDSMKGIK